jgi:hypothetical protein
MQNLLETFASWATILGTILTLLGIVQSRAWLAVSSLAFLGVAIAVGAYLRLERRKLKSAAIRIEGRSIDSLNAANLRRVVNRSLVVQEVRRTANIAGQDLTVRVEYSGYCRASSETKFEFSIDSDNNIPFADLECQAYDLLHDPDRLSPIRPILVGPDGVSKKLTVPFLEPVTSKQPFLVSLTYKLPGCMNTGVDYYAASLSFAQDRIPRCEVALIFESDFPAWVRVYEVHRSGRVRLVKALKPVQQSQDRCEYVDVNQAVPSQSARVYLFFRLRSVRGNGHGHAKCAVDTVPLPTIKAARACEYGQD